MDTPPYFYFDRSKKIVLTESPVWAFAYVDDLLPLLGAEGKILAEAGWNALTPGIRLIRRSVLTPEQTRLMNEAHALQPTLLFENSEPLLIVEQSISCETPISDRQLCWLNSLGIAHCALASSERDEDGCEVFVHSRRVVDILTLINRLREKEPRLKPAPLFLRVYSKRL